MNEIRHYAQQVERQRQLLHRKDHVSRQIADLTEKTSQLQQQWLLEQSDVDKLQKRTLTALLYELTGQIDRRLEKEQQEALAAAAKYHAAAAELEQVRRQREQICAELDGLQDCEALYAEAKGKRAEEIKAQDPRIGAKLLELENDLGAIANQKREVREALDAGVGAGETADLIQDELEFAEHWNTLDLFGGGLMTEMAKHGHLDKAQALAEQLQVQLRQFKTELADVEVHTALDIQIDEFLKFADWFFDGLIVDWTMQEKIRQAREDVRSISREIQSSLDRLDRMQSQLLGREEAAGAERDRILLETRLQLQ